MGSRIIPGLLAAIGVCQHCSDATLWRKLRQKPRWVRCLAILGLCLFVTARSRRRRQTQRPWTHHNQGYDLRSALFRDLKTGAFCVIHPSESILTTG
jgi:hypothetical protein